MKVISTQLSYILKALFRDTPLAYSFCISGGHMAMKQVAQKNLGKWGIYCLWVYNFWGVLWPYHTYLHGLPKQISKIPTLR